MRRAIAFVHRVHRWSGTALALLMAAWFASGAVMTFKAYPAYTDAERRAHALPLTAAASSAVQQLAEPSAEQPRAGGGARVSLVPRALEEWLGAGGLASGQARLAMIQGEPRWLLRGAGGYRVLPEVSPLDAQRARGEVERTHGPCRGPIERVDRADQWTVGRTPPGSFPLLRMACEDASGLELYVSTRSGEIVQESTRSERVWAWLGPITHWIYPAVLRRERELWRDLVLWISAFGCVVTVSGMFAGVHAALRSKRSVKRQTYLRWHQRLGLAFGAMAFAWVFSGALSLEPFHWSSPASTPADRWSMAAVSDTLPQQLSAALESCRRELPALRELELVAAGRLYAVCSDAASQTRIVELDDPLHAARQRISDTRLEQLAQHLNARLTLATAPDDYHYPTHSRPIALPYARFALPDSDHTILYLDPSTGQVTDQIDDKRRYERWLYHGLHSWDFQALYQHRVLWRTTVIAAMLVGLALSISGLLIIGRRQLRARRTRR
jgi:hypothetical protein